MENKIIFLEMRLIDFLMTAIGLSSGKLVELNPIGKFVIENIGFVGLAVFVFVDALVVLWLVSLVASKYQRWIMIGYNLIALVPVLVNGYFLIKLFGG